jgi:uncharacterized protein
VLWIDLENTPQVLFLEPIGRWALEAGLDVVITARPHAQTVDLAQARGMSVEVVGAGNRSARYSRFGAAFGRIIELRAFARRRRRIRALVSSSRSASLAARSLGIPSIGIMDYEHSFHWPLAVSSVKVLMPDLLAGARLPRVTRWRSGFFAGLKENLYLDRWEMDRPAARRSLGLAGGDLMVLARPPAEWAHYSTDLSSKMWIAAARQLLGTRVSAFAVMPRDDAQGSWAMDILGNDSRVRILPSGVQGPELVNAADLVLGGGGTMNREAAVLGTPVWSTFCGPSPHIDECLGREGRLKWVRNEEDLRRVGDEAFARLPKRGPYPEGLASVVKVCSAECKRAA